MNINSKNFVPFYGASALLGIIPFCHVVMIHLSSLIFSPFSVRVYPHVQPFFYPEKKVELLGYLMCLIFMSTYSLAIAIKAKNNSIDSINPKYFLPVICISAAANLLMWTHWSPAIIVQWPSFASLPFILNIKPLRTTKESLTLKKCLGILSLLSLTGMFLPFLFQNPRMESEYYNIPTSTILHHAKSTVDSIQYLHDDLFLGMVKDNPLTTNENEKKFPAVSIEETPQLKNLLNEIQEKIPSSVYSDIRSQPESILPLAVVGVDPKGSVDSYSIIYYRGKLLAIGEIPDLLEEAIEKCLPLSDHDKIAQLAAQSRALSSKLQEHTYTLPERDFLLENHHEFVSEVLARRIFHHQNFMLGPIQELDCGRPVHDVNFQYGFLPIYFFQKMLHFLGGVTYQSYFHLLNFFYPFYILTSTILVRYITKSSLFALLYFGFSTCVVAVVGYDILAIAPGMNPIRHLFDQPTIALCLAYLKNRKLPLLLIIYLLCLVSIYINSQSGISLTLAVTAGFSCLTLFDNQGWRRLPIGHVFIAIAGLFLAFKLQPGKDELSFYYFEGLCGFPTHIGILLGFTCLCAMGYLLLIRNWKEIPQSEKTLLLILMFYSQTMFIYYIWGGSKYHFLNYSTVYFLTFVTIYRLSFYETFFSRLYQPFIANTSVLILSTMLFFCSLQFFFEEYEYMAIFRHHETYQWQSSKASLITTMPESPFADAVSAIKEYEPSEGINIISEYDNLIPFLANKYSAMPYPDLQWFINSESEKEAVITYLKGTKPTILFTDANIERELGFEIINSHVPIVGDLQSESILRVQRLRVLQDIFNSVKDDYTLIKKSGLVAVWESIRKLEPQLNEVVQLIILDNCSTVPVTVNPLSDFVSIRRNPVNLGGNGNILRCLEFCQSTWIWILGDDDEVMDDSVDRILREIAITPDALVINFSTSGAFNRKSGFTGKGRV